MNPSAYPGLISGIFNAIIGVYILSINPKKIIHKAFFLMVIGFILFNIGEFFVRISTVPEDALFWGKINYSVLWITVSFSLIFVIHFPRKTIPKKYDTTLKYLEALVVITGLIVYIIFINQLSLQNVHNTEWGYRVTLTFSSIFILIWLIIITIISFFVLIHKYFYGELYRYEKKQIKIFSWGIIFVPLGAVLTNLIPPLLNIKIFPMASIFILIFSLWVAYSIKKYQFLFPSSELIAENILETMNESVIVVDKNYKIISVNKSTVELLGFDKKSLTKLSLNDVVKFPSNKGLNEFNQEKKLKVFEATFRAKNSKEIPMSISPTKIYDEEDNFVGMVLVGGDLTETKKSLREKEILLKEIHHRVKNNLQLIHSLLELQSDQIKDKQILDKFNESKDRIKLMASFYEQLYQSKNVGEIDFKGYIQNIITDLFQSHKAKNNIDLKMDIDSIILDFDLALTCGFIVSELVTNSLKHGFPEKVKGVITVGFHKKDDIFRLEVSDSGIGIPSGIDIGSPKSLGLNLVNIFVKELKGNMTLDKKNGTRFIIDIPQDRKVGRIR